MKQMEKMNEAVGIKNRYMMDGGGKRVFRPFKRQEFWKCIGCILSVFTYGNKGHNLWIDTPKASCRMAPPKIRRDVRRNTNLYTVCRTIVDQFGSRGVYFGFGAKLETSNARHSIRLIRTNRVKLVRSSDSIVRPRKK